MLLLWHSLKKRSEPPTHLYIIGLYITPFFLEPVVVFTVAECNRESPGFSLLQQEC